MCPSIDDIEDQMVDGGENVAHAVWSGLTAPPAVTRLSHQEHSKLRHNPDDNSSERAWNNQTRDTAERRFGNCVESSILVVLTVELDRLESAYVTGDEREDGYADTPLNKDTEKRPLKHTRSCLSRRGREEEIAIESACDVS
ncbi:hypothetical protein RRF57_000816 [Xylaria bambusicola]|uniref:Uncharacterized protein n=1 Tax=Xylaria bambusicola TaxID=326684 RepID=A0AAN7YUH0_9PEZI